MSGLYEQLRKTNHPDPYFAEGSEPMHALESMVDAVGMRNVLYALESLANAKADHLRGNWQDAASAKLWERDARTIERAASKLVAG